MNNTMASFVLPATSGRTFRRRAAVLAATAGLGLALSACGSNDTATGTTGSNGTTSPTSAAPSSGGISSVHNAADVTFINEMTPHHTGAIDMAELAATRAANPDVKALAAKIAAAQAPEQQKMAAMAAAWGVPAPSTDASAMTGMSGMSASPMPSGNPSSSGMPGNDMPGMEGMGGMLMPSSTPSLSSMDGSSMAGILVNSASGGMDTSMLQSLSGPAFDRMFLTMMIEHHSSALPMAQSELKNGSNPQAKQLAQGIVMTQTAEIKQMQAMLAAM